MEVYLRDGTGRFYLSEGFDSSGHPTWTLVALADVPTGVVEAFNCTEPNVMDFILHDCDVLDWNNLCETITREEIK